MQVIRNNNKISIIKTKNEINDDCYKITNKTNKLVILHDHAGNYITIRPQESYETKDERVKNYV